MHEGLAFSNLDLKITVFGLIILSKPIQYKSSFVNIVTFINPLLFLGLSLSQL